MNHAGNRRFLTQLKDILGGAQLLTGERSTERYRKGFLSGEGKALAVVFPSHLLHIPQPSAAIVAHARNLRGCRQDCHYAGSQYRLDRRLYPPVAMIMTEIMITTEISLSSARCASIRYRCWTPTNRWSPSPAVP